MLHVPSSHSHSGNSYLSEQYVLRACNSDYRSQMGTRYEYSSIPELDGCKQAGKIAPLTTFRTPYGHCVDGITRVLEPSVQPGIREWIRHIDTRINNSIGMGYAWDLRGAVSLKVSNLAKDSVLSVVARAMVAQIEYNHSPICVYSAMAYIESKSSRSDNAGIYGIPSQSTLMNGVLGGINNNTTVEMGFDEPDGVRDEQKRAYTEDLFGFICCGHTAHSEDAGKSRRVASYTRVRVVSKSILERTFESVLERVSCSGAWLVYCMGSVFSTDLEGVAILVDALNTRLRDYGATQFNYPHNKQMCVPPTYSVYYREKILCISVCSGVLVRLMPNSMVLDSAMYHHQPPNPIITHCTIPSSGTSSIMYKYSAFFMLCPYLEDDRPPRTLIASGQTVQSVCAPWAPATARVSPCHVSKPLVATEYMRNIQRDQELNEEAMWDILPGEDMTVCFMNSPWNYDDSMVVSSRFADYGGFQTISICTYRLFSTDSIPSVGEEICSAKYKWWKMPCTQHCVCRRKGAIHRDPYSSISRVISNPRIPTAIVTESSIAENGEYQVRILSHAQLMTGDKISTTHGQKGIVAVTDVRDLPVVIMKDGTSMTADLYMAVGSITSRQTVGQVFESACAYDAAVDGERDKIPGEVELQRTECKYLLEGETGKVMVGLVPDGKKVPLRASVGIVRVFNQTQLTRERHHLTHLGEGRHSLGTASGRAAGGGVATSEMDFHAMFSSGMVGCAQELLDRGNVVKVHVCTHCKHIQILCDCGEKDHRTVPTRISYDTVIFDIISACVNGSANTYSVEHV